MQLQRVWLPRSEDSEAYRGGTEDQVCEVTGLLILLILLILDQKYEDGMQVGVTLSWQGVFLHPRTSFLSGPYQTPWTSQKN